MNYYTFCGIMILASFMVIISLIQRLKINRDNRIRYKLVFKYMILIILMYSILIAGYIKLKKADYIYDHFIYSKTIHVRKLSYVKFEDRYYVTIEAADGNDYIYSYFDIENDNSSEIYIGKKVYRASLFDLLWLEKYFDACTDDETVTEQKKSFTDKMADRLLPFGSVE